MNRTGMDGVPTGYRNEWKYEISLSDLMEIRNRLKILMRLDENASETAGNYVVHSLYFETDSDQTLWEKVQGINEREKFRLRYYNRENAKVRLERKRKRGGLCKKDAAALRPETVSSLLNGDEDWIERESQSTSPMESLPAILWEFAFKMRDEGLRPRTVVEYVREPYVFPIGNVRVTFDYHLRRGLSCAEFLHSDYIALPVGKSPIIMEVKWDSVLPTLIRDAIRTPGRPAQAFSKYAQCRIYE